MNLKKRSLGAALAALSTLGLSSVAQASSHREAPAISNDPAADNTDLWAWMSADNSKLYVVASYIPLEEPSGGPNFHKFSDDVLYEVHITKPAAGGAYSLDDKLTYQVRFHSNPFPLVDPGDLNASPGGGKEFFSQLSGQSQTYSVTKVDSATGTSTEIVTNAPVAPANIGPRTQGFLNGAGVAYDQAFVSSFIQNTTSSGKFWAGPTDDGFYVDLGGIFDLANLRPAQDAQGTVTDPAVDGLAGFNVHTISMAIPVTEIFGSAGVPHPGAANDENTVGVWASASRRKVRILRNDGSEAGYGPWTQVSRLGLPLVNEALIGLQDKDKYNRTSPKDDVGNFGSYFLSPVLVRDAEVVGVYGAGQQAPSALRSNRFDLIGIINLNNIPSTAAHAIPLTATGDVLRVDTGVASGFPDGRPLPMDSANLTNQETDVTDVLLSLILLGDTTSVKDGVNHNDKNYPGQFPFLAVPWEGFSQGHGKVASP
jgi:hypothetical protein